MLNKSAGDKRSTFQKMREFFKDSCGNVSIFFALSLPVMLVAIGSGLDSARITREYSTFHAAVDSAVVALAKDTRASVLTGSVSQANMTALTSLAKTYISTNYSPDQAFTGEVTVDLTVTGQKIVIDAGLEFPTTLMKLVGIETVSMHATSEVALAARPIELVMVLDSTTSLGSSGLAAVKAAAKELLTKLYASSTANYSKYIRVGLVPFAAVTKSNPATVVANEWFDPRLVPGATLADKKAYLLVPANWNGCMGARARHATNDALDYLTNDTPPTTDETKFPPLYLGSNSNVAYIDNRGRTRYRDDRYDLCATISKMVPLTYKRQDVDAGITAMALTDNTNISEGIAWGMRAISSGQPYTTVDAPGVGDPNAISPYNDVEWQKIVVLMSDGENTQPAKTTDTTAPSLTMAQMDADTLKMCSRLKTNGVIVYTVGFTTDSTLLKDCATVPSSKYYKYAATTSDLTAFFNNIGQTVNKMIYVSK